MGQQFKTAVNLNGFATGEIIEIEDYELEHWANEIADGLIVPYPESQTVLPAWSPPAQDVEATPDPEPDTEQAAADATTE